MTQENETEGTAALASQDDVKRQIDQALAQQHHERTDILAAARIQTLLLVGSLLLVVLAFFPAIDGPRSDDTYSLWSFIAIIGEADSAPKGADFILIFALAYTLLTLIATGIILVAVPVGRVHGKLACWIAAMYTAFAGGHLLLLPLYAANTDDGAEVAPGYVTSVLVSIVLAVTWFRQALREV